MSQEIVLKDCPCCGPTERTDLKPFIRWDANHKWSFVQCPICGVRTGQSPEDWAAAHQWNTRFYEAEIERLRAQVPRWVPVTKRLPPLSPGGYSAVYETDSPNGTARGQYGDGRWFGYRGDQLLRDVTHWLEVPEAPRPPSDFARHPASVVGDGDGKEG